MKSSPGRALLSGAGLAFLLLAAGPGHARTRRAHDGSRKMSSYDRRIDRFEAIMNRFYRGESIGEARRRHNALVKKHNKRVAAGNDETKAAEKKLELALKPLRKVQAVIKKMDKKLEGEPNESDRNAVRRYNALIKRRNARVRQANELSRQSSTEIDAYNELVARAKAEVDASSDRLEAARRTLDARVGDYEEFHESEKDLAFFRDVNRFYADLHDRRRRSGGTRELNRAIRNVRSLRRELGAWAIAEHERRDYGLVVIETTLGGIDREHTEPCFFIVDTGAMRTTVAPGLVAALGIALGDETEFRLAGGKKVKGRQIVLPSVAVGKVTEKDVDAAAVKVSDVGVDGLLGQSFLKRFVYAIDESRKGKLILRPRKTK